MTDIDSVKGIIDTELAEIKKNKEHRKTNSGIKERKFNLKNLLQKTLPELQKDKDISDASSTIYVSLGSKITEYIFIKIFRFAFFGQFVLERGGAANYISRWSESLQNNSRFSTYEECLKIFKRLITSCQERLKEQYIVDKITTYANNNYKYCIDYKYKILDEKIHISTNIDWLWHEDSTKIINLHKFLTSKTKNPDYHFLFSNLYSKVITKAYLTDRSQTGEHPTNRELRWETPAKSVHFALCKDCIEIEYKLVKQVFEFDGFPKQLIDKLIEENIISENDISKATHRCPITMEKLSFEKFRQELINPTHGESTFHVGHIIPLKSDDTATYSSFHTADNICWITSIGNEIQKDRSVEDTQNLIKQIYKNYQEVGIV